MMTDRSETSMRNVVSAAVAAALPFVSVRGARARGAMEIDNGGLGPAQAEQTGDDGGSLHEAQAEQIDFKVQWWMAIGESSGWL